MISCREATKLAIKKGLGRLSFTDSMRLRLHLSMCKFCALFSKQNKFIDDALSHLDESSPDRMPDEMKTRVLERIGK